MKIPCKILFYCIIAVAFSCFTDSCSTGVKKDLLSGLKTSYNGLNVEETFLVVNGKKISSNKIGYGKKVFLIMEGITGYEMRDSLVSVGCSVMVTDYNGDKVYDIPDLFSETYEGVSPELVKAISVHLLTSTPLKAGETYHWTTRVWDKYSDGEIKCEVTIIVTGEEAEAIPEGLWLNKEDISCYNAYLSVQEVPLTNGRVQKGDEVTLNFMDVKGFIPANGNYMIRYLTHVKDPEGGIILEYVDTLVYNDVTYLKSILTVDSPMTPGNSYKWFSGFSDLNGNGKIEGEAEIEVIE